MPDWNPVEIIEQDQDSATSLYKELITNNIWAEQRFSYGYRDVRGFPWWRLFWDAIYWYQTMF